MQGRQIMVNIVVIIYLSKNKIKYIGKLGKTIEQLYIEFYQYLLFQKLISIEFVLKQVYF